MKKYFKRIYPGKVLYFGIVWIPHVDNKMIWTVPIWQIEAVEAVESNFNTFLKQKHIFMEINCQI